MAITRSEWLAALLEFSRINKVENERIRVVALASVSMDPDDDEKVETAARLVLKELVDMGYGEELVKAGLSRQFADHLSGVDPFDVSGDPLGIQTPPR